MASFSDDFNRSDGALGSDWSSISGFSALQIDTNKVEASAVGFCAMKVATATATFANDQWAQVAVSSVTNFDYAGVGVRQSGTRGYMVDVYPTGLALRNYVSAASRSDIGSGYIGTINGGDVIRVEATGTSLVVKVNGSTVITETDASYGDGQPWLIYEFGDSNTTKLDDFSAADAGGGGSLGVRSYYAFG